MDWNGKWDWENLVSFGQKAVFAPNKLGLGDLFIAGGEIESTSAFNIFPGTVGHNASAESSTRDSPGNSSSNKVLMQEIEKCGVGDVEPLIGLKLGKRTYFENSGTVSNVKAPSSKASDSSRTKSTYRNNAIPRCIVEGCAVDLSTAKEYHRKHKVCEHHSRSSKVIVGGVERRFCQQCSRFHHLSEFDDMKRSCRRRLFDHNARRRKPQPKTILLNSTGPPSPFYGVSEKIGFSLSNGPDFHSRNYGSSQFTTNRDHSISRGGDGSIDNAMHVPSSSGPFASKIPTLGFLDSGRKQCYINSPPQMEAATEYGRALSLLSTNNCWDSCGVLPAHGQEIVVPPAAAEPPVMYGVTEESLPHYFLHSSAQTCEPVDSKESSHLVPEDPTFYQNGPQITNKNSSMSGFY